MLTRLFITAVGVTHRFIADILEAGMAAVDATAGNGHDTVFLAGCVGEIGKVFAFDIQRQALIKTEELLRKNQVKTRVKLINDGHENLNNYIKEPIQAMVFNLGYLPGGDKEIITKPETTLPALKAGMELLSPNGIIALTVYTGHPGGKKEWNEIKKILDGLPQEEWDIVNLIYPNRRNAPPFNVLLQKIGSRFKGGVLN